MKNLVCVIVALVFLPFLADCASGRGIRNVGACKAGRRYLTRLFLLGYQSQPNLWPVGQLAPSNITQVWANEGSDKVTRDELRARPPIQARCTIRCGTGQPFPCLARRMKWWPSTW